MGSRVPVGKQDSTDRIQSDDRFEAKDARVPYRIVGKTLAEAVSALIVHHVAQ